jgi:hypothetical protein
MLKKWMENYRKSMNRSMAIERRAMKADAEMRHREKEMMAWARAKSAERNSVLSGMY